jgi:hypothetical protein
LRVEGLQPALVVAVAVNQKRLAFGDRNWRLVIGFRVWGLGSISGVGALGCWGFGFRASDRVWQ